MLRMLRLKMLLHVELPVSFMATMVALESLFTIVLLPGMALQIPLGSELSSAGWTRKLRGLRRLLRISHGSSGVEPRTTAPRMLRLKGFIYSAGGHVARLITILDL